MKIHVKFKTAKGGWAWLKCSICQERAVFRSWEAVRRRLDGDSRVKCYKAVLAK